MSIISLNLADLINMSISSYVRKSHFLNTMKASQTGKYGSNCSTICHFHIPWGTGHRRMKKHGCGLIIWAVKQRSATRCLPLGVSQFILNFSGFETLNESNMKAILPPHGHLFLLFIKTLIYISQSSIVFFMLF